jgi:hypothetical protein
MPCRTMPQRKERRERRHRPSFHEGANRVFTLQTKWTWSHNNNASNEEYVSECSRCWHRRRSGEAFARLQIQLHAADLEA